MRISLRLNPETADRFLVGTGHSVGELLNLANQDEPLPKFPLQVTIRAHVAAQPPCPGFIGAGCERSGPAELESGQLLSQVRQAELKPRTRQNKAVTMQLEVQLL